MISVVLGSYNRVNILKKFIHELIDAYKFIKHDPDIIVIDAGSTDGTIEFLETQQITLIKENGLHGCVRGYNRGFRLAKYKYLTWLSDDMSVDNNFLKNALESLAGKDFKTVLNLCIDNNNGEGIQYYKDVTPVLVCTKKLCKMLDFWNEDYFTYSSDTEFCYKTFSVGGTFIINRNCVIQHYLNYHDDAHNKNEVCNVRHTDHIRHRNVFTDYYRKIFINKQEQTLNIYPNVWINASSKEELLNKIYKILTDYSACNMITNNTYGIDNLNMFNIKQDAFKGNNYYNTIL